VLGARFFFRLVCEHQSATIPLSRIIPREVIPLAVDQFRSTTSRPQHFFFFPDYGFFPRFFPGQDTPGPLLVAIIALAADGRAAGFWSPGPSALLGFSPFQRCATSLSRLLSAIFSKSFAFRPSLLGDPSFRTLARGSLPVALTPCVIHPLHRADNLSLSRDFLIVLF